jgi:hypothetical protein
MDDGDAWTNQNTILTPCSMSLGGVYSRTMNRVVDQAYKAGIVVVVAGGTLGAFKFQYRVSIGVEWAQLRRICINVDS